MARAISDAKGGANGADTQSHFRVAKWIIVGSFSWLLLITVIMVGAAYYASALLGKPDKLDRLVTMLFNGLLPMIGTWIGTVIA